MRKSCRLIKTPPSLTGMAPPPRRARMSDAASTPGASMSAQHERERLRSYEKLFIGGNWTTPSSSRVIEVISPTTEEIIAHVPEGQAADIDAAVAAARH